MAGSLALVGSGEYLPAMQELERSLIDDGIKNGKKPIYIQIPTAAGQESKVRLQYWRELGERQAEALDIEARFLPIYDRESALNSEFAVLIEDAALIYMSGGDPHYLATTLIDTPIWSAIHENWSNGSSLAGCSAGAMVLSSHIPNFRFTSKPPTPGFDLIPNIRVIPHFNKFFRWIPESAATVLLDAPEETILIGIDELTALTKQSKETQWRVHGEAKVHILKGLPKSELVNGETISLENIHN